MQIASRSLQSAAPPSLALLGLEWRGGIRGGRASSGEWQFWWWRGPVRRAGDGWLGRWSAAAATGWGSFLVAMSPRILMVL
jgi:hypothetical protein